MSYIISEISGQYGGSLNVAEQMILQSKFGGADAVKVQLFSPDFKHNGVDPEKTGEYLSLKFDELKRLKEFADALHIEFFASVFDEERLEWCLKLNLPKIKVTRAISEKHGLFEKALKTGKPTILTLNESQIKNGQPYKDQNIIYLYTVPNYPAMLEEINMPDFENSWLNGYSDHTPGLAACFYALCRGAKVIEKHFTLDPSWQRTKEKAHLCSMDVNQLQQLKTFARSFDILKNKKLYHYES